MGWWIIPVGISIFCLWLVTDTSNSVPRDLLDAVMSGTGAVIDTILAIIIFVFSWMVYFLVV